jgi:membrane-associated phospholipid phosphatase
MKNNQPKIDMTNVIHDINCNIPCNIILKAFNSCPINDSLQKFLSYDFFFHFTKRSDSINILTDVLLILLSISPYVLSFLILLNTIYYKTLRSFLIMLMFFFQNFVVEILKNNLKDPRPNYLCSKQFGNPSNHAVFFSSLLMWIILEYFYLKPKHYNNNLLLKFVLFLTLPFILYSRIYLKYHTLEQIITGIFTGILFGILYFLFFVKFVFKSPTSLGRMIGKLNLKNNMTDVDLFELNFNSSIDSRNNRMFNNVKKIEELSKKKQELKNLKTVISGFKDSVKNIDIFKNLNSSDMNENVNSEYNPNENFNKTSNDNFNDMYELNQILNDKELKSMLDNNIGLEDNGENYYDEIQENEDENYEEYLNEENKLIEEIIKNKSKYD